MTARTNLAIARDLLELRKIVVAICSPEFSGMADLLHQAAERLVQNAVADALGPVANDAPLTEAEVEADICRVLGAPRGDTGSFENVIAFPRGLG